jgi:protein arginine kinase activator
VFCDHCHHNEATIHLVMEEGSGQKRAIHLCLSCALKSGGGGGLPLPPGQLAEVLKQFGEKIGGPLAEALKAAEPEPPPPEPPLSAVCPDCGTSDADFRRRQQVGCATCYQVFAEAIQALLPGLHPKGTRHRGRGPLGTGTGDSREHQLRLRRLRQQLAAAVAAEAYERASQFRDEIQRLEQEDGPR